MPVYLKGGLPRDYEFDPRGLDSNPADLQKYVEAELFYTRNLRRQGILALYLTSPSNSDHFECIDSAP